MQRFQLVMKDTLTISTVTPVYYGQDYLEKLIVAIDEVRRQWEAEGCPFRLAESIFVNDDAIDASAEVLERLALVYPWVRVITNSRNFGQHPATIAGILHSSGDWVVTLDEDLQHDPHSIGRLLELAVLERLDIVYARPQKGVHQSLVRDWGSKTIKLALMILTGNKNVPHFNSFRLVRGPLARAAASMCSHETYLEIGLSWFTNRISSLQLEMRDERFIKTGKSGYNIRRLLSHARRMLVSSQTKVMRLGVYIGLAVMAVDFTLGLRTLMARLTHPESADTKGWTSLFLAILFLGGISLLMTSVILEYLTGVVLHIQGKPTFFIVDRSKDAVAERFFRETRS